jgi:hypothetical protein
MPWKSQKARTLTWPRGAVGALALVVAVESWVAGCGDAFTSPLAAGYRFVAREATQRATPCELLCFGDSLTKFDVAPAVLSARTGRSAFNLAILGGQPPASYFALNRALRAGARPAALVFDCDPSVLATDPRINVRNLSELLDLRDSWGFAWVARDASLFARLALGRLLPSYGGRHEVRRALLASLRGEARAEPTGVADYERNWRDNRGALVHAPGRTNTGAPTPEERAAYLPEAWGVDRVNATYLWRFLGLAESRGLRVYWLVPPMAPGLQALLKTSGHDERYTRLVRAAQERFPFVTVVDGRNACYELSAFHDRTHLNSVGAATLSAGLGDLLRTDLASQPGKGRWLELPRYSPDPFPLVEIERPTRLATSGGGQGSR